MDQTTESTNTVRDQVPLALERRDSSGKMKNRAVMVYHVPEVSGRDERSVLAWLREALLKSAFYETEG